MPYQFPHYPITILFLCVLLDRIGNIPDTTTGHRLPDPLVQRFLGYADQLHDLRTRITNGKRIGMIAMIAFSDYADIDGNNISCLQRMVIGETMHHHIIDGNAGSKRIPAIIEEGWNSSVVPNKFADQLVQL